MVILCLLLVLLVIHRLSWRGLVILALHCLECMGLVLLVLCLGRMSTTKDGPLVQAPKDQDRAIKIP
jgi:hypothetical protein